MQMQKIDATEIARLAPAAVATRAHPRTSTRYGFINTADVLGALASEGYVPVSAKQNSRTRPAAGKHGIVLAREEDLHKPAMVGGTMPRILLENSHDATGSLTIRQGLFRFVCANGLTVGKSYAEARIKHSRDIALDVLRQVQEMAKQSSKIFRSIESWETKELNPRQAIEFAQRAAQLRFGDNAEQFAPGRILEARRVEDAGRSLWTVYNRVQENLVRGGVKGFNAEGERVTSRALTGLASDVAFNSALWDLAEEFAN